MSAERGHGSKSRVHFLGYSLIPHVGHGVGQQLTHILTHTVFGGFPSLTYIVGADWYEGPPVPIPNTEVKLASAHDTWLETARKNR